MIKAFVQQKFLQSRKAILVGTVPFIELQGRVWLSYREKSLIEAEGDDIKSSAYQRQIDQTRVRSIAQYIVACLISNSRGSADVIFPNSIILASPNDDEVVQEGEKSWTDLVFSDADYIEIPVADNTMIVDGQHRFAGMKYLYEEARKSETVFGYSSSAIISFIEGYVFNCSVLFNYDMWEQAQVFANVNFNQKKVNKSLFYDIYGVSIPLDESTIIPKQNEIFLAHALVGYLNSNDKSSLKGYIKMLGTGSGYVSQAFLVEALMRLLSPSGVWSDAVALLRNHEKGYNYIALELIAFFNATREVFADAWPKENEKKPSSVICKTTGLGALILLLSELHRALDEKTILQLKNDSLSNETYLLMRSYFTIKMKPLSFYTNELFSLTGKYASGAGVGMQKSLFNRMKELLTSMDNG